MRHKFGMWPDLELIFGQHPSRSSGQYFGGKEISFSLLCAFGGKGFQGAQPCQGLGVVHQAAK